MDLDSTVRKADDPWLGGRAPHVPFGPGKLPRVCLLPGDPARVDLAASVLADLELIGQNREFRLAIGTFEGQRIAICSTGIGGPSTEIAVVELQRLGVDTFLRIGGMGAVKPELTPGSLTYVAVALRESGAARFYAPTPTEIPADQQVLEAFQTAAAGIDVPLVPIRVLSCDSYYVGEGRRLTGLEALAERRYLEVVASGADAMDMETETVFAVAQALNCRYGALLISHANRATNAWLEDYEPVQLDMLRIAASAAAQLSLR